VRVLMGLNPDEGSSFISVCVDDAIIYSETPEKHLKITLSVAVFCKGWVKT